MKIGIITLGIFVVTSSCNLLLEHKLGTSVSIKDSQDRDVFIASLNLIDTTDSLDLSVQEVWIEKLWRFDRYDYNKSITGDGYQIILTGDSTTIWSLTQELQKQKAKPPFGPVGRPDRLTISLDSLPMSDTIQIRSLVFVKLTTKY